MPKPGQKWIVGLDLRPRSQGAMRFGAWLAGSTEGWGPLVGIHVIEDDHMRAALRYHHYDEVMKAAREATDLALSKLSLTDSFDEVHVVQGKSPERTLEAARTYHHAQGIIIGRYAKTDSISVRRLGKVARRVLRNLASPVIVVSPEWEPSEAKPGPVIASCNMRADSAHAVRFASKMAKQLGVELVLVHVVPLPHDYGAHYLPAESLEKIRGDHQREGEEAMGQYVEDYGFAGCKTEVRQGSSVEQLVDAAKTHSASMLVTGSRRLSAFERFLLSSIGSELAATAPCPVAVVPPEAADQSPTYALT